MTLQERLKLAAERFAIAIRDAQATHDVRGTSEPAQEVRPDHDDALAEIEAQRQWAMGGLEYREAQLAKFNGKQETPDEYMERLWRENAVLHTPEAIAEHTMQLEHAVVLPTPVEGDDGSGDEIA